MPEPRTHYGVDANCSAWVVHGETRYRLQAPEGLDAYEAGDFEVIVERGPDVLNHDYLCDLAVDAFRDAYGSAE